MNYERWIIGISMLSFSLILSSSLGNLQQYGNTHYGLNVEEDMLYNHLLSLPFFYFLFDEILEHVKIFNNSKIYFNYFPIPTLWILAILNIFSQNYGVQNVFYLNKLTDSLTTTLILTIRKFLSLLISLYMFNHKFSIMDWSGAILIFGGSLIYLFDKNDKIDKKN